MLKSLVNERFKKGFGFPQIMNLFWFLKGSIGANPDAPVPIIPKADLDRLADEAVQSMRQGGPQLRIVAADGEGSGRFYLVSQAAQTFFNKVGYDVTSESALVERLQRASEGLKGYSVLGELLHGIPDQKSVVGITSQPLGTLTLYAGSQAVFTRGDLDKLPSVKVRVTASVPPPKARYN